MFLNFIVSKHIKHIFYTFITNIQWNAKYCKISVTFVFIVDTNNRNN